MVGKKKFSTCETQTAHFLKARVNAHRWKRKGLTIRKENQRTCAGSAKFTEKWVTVAFNRKKGAYSHCGKKCKLKLLWETLYTYYINLAKKRRLFAHTLRIRNKPSVFAALWGRGWYNIDNFFVGPFRDFSLNEKGPQSWPSKITSQSLSYTDMHTFT